MMKRYGLLGILTLMSALFTLPTRAEEPPQLYISEINWAGSQTSTADEWIEIVNVGTETIDVSNWIVTGIGTSGGAIAIAEGTIIEGGKTLLIANYNLSDPKTTLNIAPNLVTTAVSIVNSNLSIQLAMPDGLVIDEYVDTSTLDYGATLPATSIERDLETLVWRSAQSSVNLLSETQLGTPGVVELGSRGVMESESGEVVESPDETDPTTEPDDEAIVKTPSNSPMNGGESATDTPSEATISEGEVQTPSDFPLTGGEGAPEVVVDEPEVAESESEEILVTDPVIDEPTTEEVVIPAEGEVAPSTIEETSLEEFLAEVPEITESDNEVIATPGPLIDEPAVVEVVDGQEADTTDTADLIDETIADAPIETFVDEPETPSASPINGGESASYATDSLVINELLPDPAVGEEWVELFNPGDVEVSTTGWLIEDASGHETELEETIPANGYILIMSPTGNLNNSGDTVTLIAPNGDIINTFTYGTAEIPSPKKGSSLSKHAGGWHQTVPTPGKKNVLPPPPAEEVTPQTYDTKTNNAHSTQSPPVTPQRPVAEANYRTDLSGQEPPRVHRIVAVAAAVTPLRDKTSPSPSLSGGESATARSTPTPPSKTTLVTMEGVVVAEPGTFGKQIAFLNGMELYFYHADWPENMKVGSWVQVTGTEDEKDGNTRIKIANASDIIVLGTEETGALEITSLAEATHSLLVTFQGTVEGRTGKSLTIMSAEGELVTVTLPKTSAINTQSLIAGAEITVTGVARRKNNDLTIALRSGDDLVVATPAATAIVDKVATPHAQGTIAPTPKQNLPLVGGGLLTTTFGALTYWYTRSKGITLPLLSN